jgi:hypothetical protein
MGVFRWIDRISRWGLGCIFILSGGLKLMAPAEFAVLIGAYGILPDPLLMPVAMALPALEVAAGFGLVIDIDGSLGVIAALLGLFVAILGYGIWMGLDVDCGCFGPEDPEARAFHGMRVSLYRDLVMLLWIAGLFACRRRTGVKPVRLSVLINDICKRRRRTHAHR